MSQDYNINMKQYNGSDYDNILPLAYNSLNSQQLAGKTYDEIQNLFTREDLFLQTGSYTGNGTYGSNNPTSVTLLFTPRIFFVPVSTTSSSTSTTPFSCPPINCSALTSEYKKITGGNSTSVFFKKSTDGRTITWYSSSSASLQSNNNNEFYYYAAIGGFDYGEAFNWLFTESQTWTVPRTGHYYLELYGNGGKGAYERGQYGDAAAGGGASCQSYDNITLTEGEKINIVCYPYSAINSPRGTTFGNYSVQAGRDGSVLDDGTHYYPTPTGGVAVGNKGATGQTNTSTGSIASVEPTYGTGKYSTLYGYGSGIGSYVNIKTYGPRAVYLSYLGD